MQTKNLDSDKVVTRTVQVNAKTLDDQLFVIPEDYRVTDMTNLNQLVKEFKGDAKRLKELRDAARMSKY